MIDLDGRNLNEADNEGMNKHKLILGRSGSGKTYFCNRKLESLYEAGEKVVVLDYSGSFTIPEMERAKFRYVNEVKYHSLSTAPFYWFSELDTVDSFVSSICDTLVELLGVRSYIQKKLLLKYLCDYVASAGKFNFSKFFSYLQSELEELQAKKSVAPYPNVDKDIENCGYLLSRLYPFGKIDHLYVSRTEYRGTNSNNKHQLVREDVFAKKTQKQGRIVVVQLSDFPEQERRFLAEFLLLLLWKETKGTAMNRFDFILLDEFQNLSLSENRAVYNLLREGRKYGLAVILSTQYVSNYGRDELYALQQVSQVLVFQPVVHDIKFCLELLKIPYSKEWEQIIKKLKTGQAVLSGPYVYEGKSKVNTNPIVVKIV